MKHRVTLPDNRTAARLHECFVRRVPKQKPWCVAYLDANKKTAWCALPAGAKPDPSVTSDPTLCGHVVMLRFDAARRTPTCPDCLREADEQVRRCLPDGTLPTT